MMKSMAKGGGMPGMPGHARHAAAASAAEGQAGAKAKKGKGSARVRQPGQGAPSRPRPREKAAPQPAGNPFGNPDGEEIDYEKAAAALDLPKDFSKFLNEVASWSSTAPNVVGVRGPGRLVEGPGRRGPPAARAAARRRPSTATSCWCSRVRRRAASAPDATAT